MRWGTGLGVGKTGIRSELGTGALGQVRHASIGIAGASMWELALQILIR